MVLVRGIICVVWNRVPYMENGIAVFAVLDATFGEDDGDEVDARLAEQGDGRGVREELQGKSASARLDTTNAW